MLKLLSCILLTLLFITETQARNPVVALKVANGQFVKAINGGGGQLVADANAAQTWERFVIVDVNGGRLKNGDQIILRTLTGHYVSADREQNLLLVANRSAALDWERFNIFRLNGTGEIKNGDTIALSVNREGTRTYVTAENGGGGELRARAGSAGAWEKFRLTELRGSLETIKLSAPFASPQMFMMPIGFDHDPAVGRFEGECRNYYGIAFPGCYDKHEGTDFMLWGHWPSQDLGFDVVAAAPGFVVWRSTGGYAALKEESQRRTLTLNSQEAGGRSELTPRIARALPGVWQGVHKGGPVMGNMFTKGFESPDEIRKFKAHGQAGVRKRE